MAVEYSGLWDLCIKKRIRKTELAEMAGIDRNILSRLGRNKYVSLPSLERVCEVLDCDIGDIVSIDKKPVKHEKKKKKRALTEIEDILFAQEYYNFDE